MVDNTLNFYIKKWLSDVIGNKYKGRMLSTIESYEGIWLNHIKDSVGVEPITTVCSGLFLYEFFSGLVENGVSESQVRTRAIVINGALSCVKENGLNHGNGMSGILTNIYRTKNVRISDRFTNDDFRRIKNSDSKSRLLFSLMIETGIRLGEAISINISDIDFDRCEIYIQRSLRAGVLTDYKTENCRILIVDDNILDEMIIESSDSGFIFTDEKGFIISQNTVRYRWRCMLKKIGLDSKKKIKDIRNTLLHGIGSSNHASKRVTP